MDMEEEILALAVALGQISESQQLRTLVRAAQLEWAGRLKEGVSPQDCASAFCIAGLDRAGRIGGRPNCGALFRR